MISITSIACLLLTTNFCVARNFNSSNIIILPGPIIQTQYGPIQGREEIYEGYKSVYTFKGVRFATAPIGNLRFRQPFPPSTWTQVFQADQHGSSCAQVDYMTGVFSGNEDCLFLNVASPTDRGVLKPVVVEFHGGALQNGAAEIHPNRPDYLVEHGIIYVSSNYRLSTLGFLNTGDRSSPGNYGIKDMIMALQWVQRNIEAFGGDPNNVSIMGTSAGGVSVHALVVSRAAMGLFHRAISHSGSLFNPYAFSRNPQKSIDILIRNLQLNVTSTQNLVDQLRTLPAETLIRVNDELRDRMPVFFEEMYFVPSIDPYDSLETRIFTDTIENLIAHGQINSVPYLVGINSMESLYSIAQVFMDPTILNRFNQDPNNLLPIEWNLTPNSPEANEVITVFRNLYFNGATQITLDHIWGWTQYVSDREFIFGVDKLTRLHWQKQSLYKFMFSYSGAKSVMQILYGLQQYQEAVHADNLYYTHRIEPFPVEVHPDDPAHTMQQTFVQLLANFIRFGNPTPTVGGLINIPWPIYNSAKSFMNINLPLSIGYRVFGERMDIWHSFDARFNHGYA